MPIPRHLRGIGCGVTQRASVTLCCASRGLGVAAHRGGAEETARHDNKARSQPWIIRVSNLEPRSRFPYAPISYLLSRPSRNQTIMAQHSVAPAAAACSPDRKVRVGVTVPGQSSSAGATGKEMTIGRPMFVSDQGLCRIACGTSIFFTCHRICPSSSAAGAAPPTTR